MNIRNEGEKASGSHKTFLKEHVDHLLFYYCEIVLQIRGKRPSEEQIEELRKHCRGGIPERMQVGKGRNKRWVAAPYYNEWQKWWVLPITMPRPEAIKLMIKWGWRVRFWKIELACDYITKTQADAKEVRDWYQWHAYF